MYSFNKVVNWESILAYFGNFGIWQCQSLQDVAKVNPTNIELGVACWDIRDMVCKSQIFRTSNENSTAIILLFHELPTLTLNYLIKMSESPKITSIHPTNKG